MKSIPELEYQVDTGKDLAKCKDDLSSVSKQLTSVAHNLSSFDQELYSTKIDHLSKKITIKQLETSNKDDRRAKWKARGRPSAKTSAAVIDSALENSKKLDAVTSPQLKDTTIYYDISENSYRNLTNCTLKYTGTEPLQEFATLSIQDVHKSIVYFNILPFNQGSLLLERFGHCKIVIITPKNSNLQLRLHEMHNCQLYIREQHPGQIQDIIIEDFSDCVFHEDTEKFVHIHNFNRLNLQNKETNGGYTFGNFPYEIGSLIP